MQSIWTAGRIGPATAPQWDIGRSPYDPEDNYNAELIACLSQITQGITCGTDTSQASHTPEHTDAMIEALHRPPVAGRSSTTAMGSIATARRVSTSDPTAGARALRIPGAGPAAHREEVLLLEGPAGDARASPGGPTVIPNLPAPYTGLTGWKLGREFGAWINNHNVGNANVPQQALDNGNAPFDDVTLVHCVRWQDNSIAQLSYGDRAYPASGHVFGLGDLGRERGPRLDRGPHRDADAPRDAADPDGAEPRDPA